MYGKESKMNEVLNESRLRIQGFPRYVQTYFIKWIPPPRASQVDSPILVLMITVLEL